MACDGLTTRLCQIHSLIQTEVEVSVVVAVALHALVVAEHLRPWEYNSDDSHPRRPIYG